MTGIDLILYIPHLNDILIWHNTIDVMVPQHTSDPRSIIRLGGGRSSQLFPNQMEEQ